MLGTLSTEAQLLVFEGITFATLIFILRRFAWKPLREALESREERIKGDVRAAEDVRRSAEELKVSCERQLAELEKVTQDLFSRAEEESRRQREEMIDAAEREKSRMFEKTRRDLEEDQNRLIRQMREEVILVSLGLTERLIRNALDKGTRQKLLDEAFESFVKTAPLAKAERTV